MPGYAVIKEYSYFHWMPPYAGKSVVLKESLLGTQNIRGNEYDEQGALADMDKSRR